MSQIQDIKLPVSLPTFGAEPTAVPVAPDPAAPAPVPVIVQKPKVLYVITKSNFGGAQQYVYNLATHVPPEYEVVVMCGKPQLSTQSALLVGKLSDSNIRTVVISELTRDVGFLDVMAFLRLYKAIKAEKPAVLHLNSSKAGGLGALAGRMAGVPRIIFTVHGWAFKESRDPLSKFLIWLASVATILLCHTVICVSKADLQAFRGMFLSRKLVAIHNALPAIEFREREEARRDLVPHDDLFAEDLWVGSIVELTPNKNVGLALKAVKNALDAGCNIFYAVVGDGEERLDLEDMAKELKIDQNVRFLGFVTDAFKSLKAFDIALLTSRKEGLPYAVIAAEQAQIPQIAPSVGGIPEIIHDGTNGLLFRSENLEELSERLIRLAKDQELRATLSSPVPVNRFDSMLRETFDLYR